MTMVEMLIGPSRTRRFFSENPPYYSERAANSPLSNRKELSLSLSLSLSLFTFFSNTVSQLPDLLALSVNASLCMRSHVSACGRAGGHARVHVCVRVCTCARLCGL